MAKSAVSTPTSPSFATLSADLRQGRYAPVYLLMGEEDYYIDMLLKQFTDDILSEEEKDFNLTVIHCERDILPAEIINVARRYPVMAERQVVIVKEAEHMYKLDGLTAYTDHPVFTTVLVICHKHGSVDRRKALIGSITACGGIIFESKRIREGQLPLFIENYVGQRGLTIDRQAVLMLAANVGSDLNRLTAEIDKVRLALPAESTHISADLIQRHVGISKDFNLFEFRAAVVEKNSYKANLILNYFLSGKEISGLAALGFLFAYFAALMQAYYAPQRTDPVIMEHLGLRFAWQMNEYRTGMRNYSATKTLAIIDRIRQADAQLKGINSGTADEKGILRELLHFILH